MHMLLHTLAWLHCGEGSKSIIHFGHQFDPALGGQRAIHTPLWFESTVQLANRNQASVNWGNMFDYLDPGGKNVTLDAQKFHDWS